MGAGAYPRGGERESVRSCLGPFNQSAEVTDRSRPGGYQHVGLARERSDGNEVRQWVIGQAADDCRTVGMRAGVDQQCVTVGRRGGHELWRRSTTSTRTVLDDHFLAP